MKHLHRVRQSWRWLFIAVAPLAAFFLALTMVLPALADSVVNVTIPFNGSITNPCNGEQIVFSGEEHENYHFIYDSNGGVHFDLDANLQDVTGTGDQGNTYQFTGTSHYHIDTQVGYEETVTKSFDGISQGSAPNFIMKTDIHITINPDGTVTSTHDNFQTECRG